jgi:hypothetical protein
MSIEAPQGILNIPNATLRVGKLAVDEVVGADTILNTVARNTILLVDGDTYHENKNWDLKLPNAWAGEFECNTASAGNYSEFNFYNEGASSNAQGYNLTFNDTAAELRYDGTLLKTGTLPSTVTGTGVKKVRLLFERTILSVTVDGTLIFTHDDTGGPRPRVYSTTAGGFLNFFTDGGALKNLKIVNEKWISDGTSNIAYVGGGEVAVGQSLNLQQVSNTSMIKMNSNVVTEFPRSKKLIKYPRVALTANSSGGYVASASSTYTNFNPYEAFDNEDPDSTAYWSGSTQVYNTNGTWGGSTAAAYTTNVGGVSKYGEWIQIQLPNKIKYNYSKIKAPSPVARQPRDGYILGSNDTTGAWTILHRFEDVTRSSLDDLVTYTPPSESTQFFQYFRLVIETISDGTRYAGVNTWDLFGLPEYDPDAHGTDVTVKSVANVPNTDWLKVYYDAKDLDDGGVTNVDDLTPSGINDGTATNVTVSDGAFVFDGGTTTNITTTTATGMGGDNAFSISLWFNPTSQVGSVDNCLVTFGNQTSREQFLLTYNPNKLLAQFFGNGMNIDVPGGIQFGRWYHVVLTYPGGGQYNMSIYADGIKGSNNNAGTNLSGLIPTNAAVELGKYTNSYNQGFNGSIANFRLFNRALTQDEIYQLYAYQKEYFGHGDLSMTLKAGRLGIGTSEPRALLDVGGVPYGAGVRPIFSAYEADGYTIESLNSVQADVILGNTFINHNNAYNTSTGVFTVPVTGEYHIFACCQWRGFSTYNQGVKSGNINFVINGVGWNPTDTTRPIVSQTIRYANERKQLNGSLVIKLNKGDQLKVQCTNNLTGNVGDLSWGTGYGRFSAFLLS